MDSTQVVQLVQQSQDIWYVTVMKLLIFSACVSAVVEAIKHFFGSFVTEEVYKLYVTASRIKTATFFVALALCWSIDYGILYTAIQPGIRSTKGSFLGIERGDIGMWADYLVTASINMMGAVQFFEWIATRVANLKAKRKQLSGGTS